MTKESQYLQKLYPLALELQDLSPWEFMYERELFGIEIPGSGSPYFASVMGSSGEFPAITFYEGTYAADQFLRIQNDPDESRPIDILLLPQLMVAFEQIEYIDQADKTRLKKQGYSLNKRKRWPVFEQVVPGHIHIFPKTEKLRDLEYLLEQTLQIARRAGKEEFAYIEHIRGGMGGQFRVPDGRTKSGWRDEYRNFESKQEQTIPAVSQQMTEKLKRIPRSKMILQVDLVMIPNPLMDREPPYFPFMLILVEKKSGYVYSPELLSPHPSAAEMIAGSGIKLVETLIDEQLHPDAIEFRSLRLQRVFEVALADTTISVRYKRWMPALEDAVESMLEYFGGGQL